MLDCPLVDTTCDCQMQIKALELDFKSEFEQIHIKIEKKNKKLNLTRIIDYDRQSCYRYFAVYVAEDTNPILIFSLTKLYTLNSYLKVQNDLVKSGSIRC